MIQWRETVFKCQKLINSPLYNLDDVKEILANIHTQEG